MNIDSVVRDMQNDYYNVKQKEYLPHTRNRNAALTLLCRFS